ncbi:class I SAM-dependent methyltransferase [Modestobacter italicus]|uniref:class I SAM-dependent methyltransferase n=1 Tax=Modestobacter italicus (strain DSM 44449 / CECT 9708 / BC 501) TaxID=2732864 RepID=UPI001C965A9C|nr:class I SAM-dependent methyltransferase [Modestobacter italicus]
MGYFDEPGAWSRYNATQVDREPRPLAVALVEHAGEGAGRLALDLGFGAGVETALLLDHGWRVLAIDGDPAAGDSLTARLPADQAERLTVGTETFAELDALPPAHLVHAGRSLPYAGAHLSRLWQLIRAALLPGGWLACDLFGERDTTTDADDIATLTDAEVDRLLTGLDVVRHEVQEADGTAYAGPQHWHTHSVLARRPSDDGS